MSTELMALLAMTLFYLFAWLPSSIGKARQYGGKWLASNRETQETSLEGAYGRAQRAYDNLKDYFPAFIVAILAIEITNSHSSVTLYGAWFYVTFRLAHFLSYTLGYVKARALFWVGSLFCNVVLIFSCF